MTTSLTCQACGVALPAAASPARCPNSGADGGDHLIVRRLDPAAVAFPPPSADRPFLRFRGLTWAHAIARSGGMGDADFVRTVRDLDESVARVDGHGFTETPFTENAELSVQIGAHVWVKDETNNVSGSHKGRHLFGLAVLHEIRAHLGFERADQQRLAIASCGNAALAAAVIARAWGRPLDVFIPPDASPTVVARLHALGATVNVCPRVEGVPGDPCTHAFRDAVAAGATPFCCQGTDHGLTVEGGETLAWELVHQTRERPLDRLFVQVGGGALASACAQGFEDALQLGAIDRLPRLHAVQTRGGFPLWRAWDRVSRRALDAMNEAIPAEDGDRAARLARPDAAEAVRDALAWSIAHRAQVMWPWETAPHSVAHGILDDETYDWYAVVRGMLHTGGWPIVVDETRLLDANRRGVAATGIDADETGTAGLAGLFEIAETLQADEHVAVLFSGHRR